MSSTRHTVLGTAAVLVLAASTVSATSASAAPERQPRGAAGELTVMSLNTWHAGGQVEDGVTKLARVVEEQDADIVGLQESTREATEALAEKLGWHHYQPAADRGFVSRFPVTGGKTQLEGAVGARVRIDEKTGQEVEFYSAHLGYTPYGPYDACFDGMSVERIMEREKESGRTPQAQEIARELAPKVERADRTPVLLVGDFNTPSHLDWKQGKRDAGCAYDKPVEWPATKAVEDAGLKDSFREAHPDPAAEPGHTWSPVAPEKNADYGGRAEPQDRIDFVDYAGSKLTVKDSRAVVTGDPARMPDHASNSWPTDHAAVVTTFAVK
ncbi:endonuclease/exonuclease/phosphatase family protein [Streptomyces sp. HNM0574]|uniref:endonuclease/exonuclease/phosphatase family protein n=1 Tax=Streptomyces sp. HNM0574 TaxID=2714954 RepID=UPI00146BD542|nr:endonuclease/exonuclease/phosphatase family protein [Streptomyces sp. HNM0574]NLU67352.1 endonuclease/exonuclease/phosphatase family protein [Streptomyces sp. HNM0574]